ncbi:MAG: ribosome silencing factor [Pseudomonadota bacterium]
MKSTKLRDLAVKALEDIKGQQIVVLDIKKISSFADYMIVVTGTSNRHVRSMADEVSKRCKDAGAEVKGMEGQLQSEWILLDLGDVIVHVMQAATRKLYDLESLWNMSPAAKA